MQHKRQAPGRDIHRHFSLAPARSHTITASSKASATATRNPPPHPVPYKTGPKLAMRRRGHHTCHSFLSLPPPHPPPAPSHAPHTSNHECAQTVKGGETPPACAPPLSGVWASSTSNRNRNRKLLPLPTSKDAPSRSRAPQPLSALSPMRRSDTPSGRGRAMHAVGSRRHSPINRVTTAAPRLVPEGPADSEIAVSGAACRRAALRG